MATIYIYPKTGVLFGHWAMRHGLDREGLKYRSTTLRKKLEAYIAEHHIAGLGVETAGGDLTPEQLIEGDGVLVLISPYLKGEMETTVSDQIVFLTEDEFDSKDLNRVYAMIYKLQMRGLSQKQPV